MKKLFVAVLSLLMVTSIAFASLYETRNSISNITYAPKPAQGIENVTDEVIGKLNYENVMRSYGFEEYAKNYSGPMTVIVELEDNSVLEEFNSLTSASVYNSAAEFAASKKGLAIASNLKSKQDSFLSRLKRDKIDYTLKYNYSGVINGVAITVDYDDIKAIEQIRGVKNVIYSETYYTPEGDAVMNDVNAYSTGIYDTTGISYTGAGMVVAILDTGLDYTHNAFLNMPDVQSLTIDMVENAVSSGTLTASTRMPGVTASELYKNGKVPFQFDYADNDADVFPVTSSHGTHVAGIIAGYEEKVDYEILPSDDNMYFDLDEDGDKTFKGVAVDAQLAIMKVFSDLGETGAVTEDIIAGLNDAVVIGVDIINMSLGSSGGFSRVSDDESVNDVYDRIREAGITLAIAAGNEYSSSYGGTYGNTNLTSNPDSSTVGSPSVYNGSISVASISGQLSPYLLANDNVAAYYLDARDAAGKNYDFMQLLLGGAETKTFNYVVVGGYGEAFNYTAEVRAKLAEGNCIAVVSRGTTSFEDKQSIAADYGAIGCIIYNNVSGVISASVGTGYKIPTCTITNDIARQFIYQSEGTITLDTSFKAGPFMSEFSSWGVSPDLHLYPDITAHGGYITSTVLGGYGVFSGTSMATPNIAGISTLIRQYLVEKFPDKTKVEINDMLYQMLMSTATIALNEEGDPYSPRKQGAGLADIHNTVSADAYLYVENSNKTKIELGDDPAKTGDYYLRFNVKNLSNLTRKYTMSSYVMTEKVSADGITVAEKAYLFDDANVRITGAESGVTYSGNVLTVAPNIDATVTVRVTLSDADKKYLNDNFVNGMFVEGYLMFEDGTTGVTSRVNLNVPFLAFYGDWLSAPMFDYSEYDVSASHYDDGIPDEDKLQADVYETVVIGRYSTSSYMPMGIYIYNTPNSSDSGVVSSIDKIAVGNSEYGIYELYGVYAGLLRGAKTMEIQVTDTVTGEVVFSRTNYEVRKSSSGGPGPIYIELSPSELNMNNNTKYDVTLKGTLDYANGENANRNTWSFSFYVDYESPYVVDASVRVSYDTNNNKSVMLTIDMYDNHYVQAFTLFTCGEDTSYPEESEDRYVYTMLQDYFTPVNSVFNGTTRVTVDITDLYDTFVNAPGNYKNKVGIVLVDYALNSAAFTMPLNFDDLTGLSVKDASGKELADYEDSTVEIEQYTPFNFKITDASEGDHEAVTYEYNSDIITVKDGVIYGNNVGETEVTITEKNTDGKPEVYTFKVKVTEYTGETLPNYEISSISFKSYVTEWGTEIAISNNYVSLDSGVRTQLNLNINPWYATDSNVAQITWSSLTPKTVSVTDDGVITTLNQGVGRVRVTWYYRNVLSEAMLTIIIGEKYTISSGYLYLYYGADEVLQIPANLGAIYLSYYTDSRVGPFYQDQNVRVAIVPSGVTSIGYAAFAECPNLETVYLPATLEGIGYGAFANCPNLKNIYWFTDAYYDTDLGYYTFGANDNTPCFDEYGNYMGGFTGYGGVVASTVADLKQCTAKNLYLWNSAFDGCYNLEAFDLSKTTALYSYAFRNCWSLASADVTSVKNCGVGVFYNCKNLSEVTFGPNTVIGDGMFENCISLKNVTLYSNVGDYAFSGCAMLKSVTFKADIESIGAYAFDSCSLLGSVEFNRNTVTSIGEYAFADCASLTAFNAYVREVGAFAFYRCFYLSNLTLDGTVTLGDDAFFACVSLTTVTLGSDATLENIGMAPFESSALTTFVVSSQHKYLSTVSVKDGGVTYTLLFNKEGTELKIAPPDYTGDYNFVNFFYEGGEVVSKIGASAYAASGIDVDTLEIPEGVTSIGDYAFAFNGFKTVILPASLREMGEGVFYGCENLETVIFLCGDLYEIPTGTFYGCTSLKIVVLPENLVSIGGSAFENCTALTSIQLPYTLKYIGNAAFFNCSDLAGVEFETGSQLESIGDLAFAFCAFEQISLPKKLASIGYASFYGCENLTSITIPGSVVNWDAFSFAMCSSLSEVIICEGVEATGAYAFMNYDLEQDDVYYHRALTSVTLPSTLTYINTYTFGYCTALTSINLEYVMIIDGGAFEGCSNLSDLGDTDNVLYLGEYAFAACASLTSVNMPNVITVGNAVFYNCTGLVRAEFENATTVANFVFRNCSALEYVNIENAVLLYSMSFYNCVSLTSINLPNLVVMGEGVFFNSGLTSFNVPASLTEMGYANFTACPNFTEFTVDEDNAVFFTDGAGLYRVLDSGDYEFVSFACGRTGLYTVLDGTVRIENMAFAYATYLNTVNLPYTLKSIGAMAFYYVGMEEISDTEVMFYNVTYVFHSLQAPALETFCPEDASETYTLYELYDTFTYYLAYNYVYADRLPIYMCYPANGVGYDSFAYDSYLVFNSLLPDAAEETTLLLIKRIAALDAETVTLEEIQSIRSIIDNLTDTQKSLVSNYAKFVEIEQSFTDTPAEEESEPETLGAAGAAIVAVIATLIVCGAAFALYLHFTKKRGIAL